MLLLTVFYSIPEFDVSSFFLLSCSSAKLNGIGNVNDLNDQTNGKIIQGKMLQEKVKKIKGNFNQGYNQPKIVASLLIFGILL